MAVDDEGLLLATGELNDYCTVAVGGIYTVIRSKAPSSIAQIGDNNYFCIGIYNGEQARTEVEVCEPPNFQMAECMSFCMPDTSPTESQPPFDLKPRH
jgi:hypothetical protein